MADQQTRQVGMVGLYDDVNALIRAAETVRDAGFSKWDCHTPYPVHGLDRAMGVKPSPVPYVTLGAGFVGLAVAIALTGGLSVWQYPIRIGGKALFSWQAFVPVTFEVGVLLGALGAVFGMLGLNQLPMHNHPLFSSKEFERASGRSQLDYVRRLSEQLRETKRRLAAQGKELFAIGVVGSDVYDKLMILQALRP